MVVVFRLAKFIDCWYSDGPALRKVIDDLKTQATLYGVELKGTKNLQAFETSRISLIDNLIECLKMRFQGDDIINSSHILRISAWPKDFEGTMICVSIMSIDRSINLSIDRYNAFQ